MLERTLAQASVDVLRPNVEVADGDGTRMLLSDIVANRPTVVAFWSRSCAPSLSQLPELQELAERLETQGVSVVPITDEPISADLTAFLAERGIDLPVYHDIRGEAIRAFDSWGTPMYYVLDAQGRLRFDHVQLQDVERFATALNRDPEGDRPVGN
jgi:thiol-disulfide isomerase/thioredoxin